MKTMIDVMSPRKRTLLCCLLSVLVVVAFVFPASAVGQTNKLILVGDTHIDRLIDHDLDWLLANHPDDYRQVTQTYAPNTAANLTGFISELLAQANATAALGVVHTGDLVEGLAGSYDLAAQMETFGMQSLRSTDFGAPWILTKGNHDITGPGATEAYQGVVLPFLSSELGQPTTTTYFSYRTGDIEVIALDCYDLGTMMTFLQQRLAASTAKYKIVTTHQPVIPVTGRLWNIYQSPADSVMRDSLLNVLARYKAIVVCGHLHYFSVVRRSTRSGPVLQIMNNSVMSDSTRHTPSWSTTDYGPALVDHEPNFDPGTATQRKQQLAEEEPYITDFQVADLPGYSILSFDDATGDPTLKVYGGLGQVLYKEISLKAYNLTIDTVGAGTVTTSPNGSSFLAGAKVVLTAQTAPGYRFMGWTDGTTDTSKANPDTLTIQSDTHITAVFEALPFGQYELRTTIQGNGTIEMDPSGPYYMGGTLVKLHGQPNPGNAFVSWSGDVTGILDTVSILIDNNKSVTANFRALAHYPFGARVEGEGTVVMTPAGGSYTEGDTVTVEAQPATGWEFAGWSGALTGTSNPATVVMNCPQEVKALFHKTGSRLWMLSPVHDSYVRGSLYAGNNFSSDTTLKVQEGGSDLSRLRSYLQFDLDTIRQGGAGALIGARLLLQVAPGGVTPEGSAGGSVHACEATSDSWTETTLTWKTAPGEGTVADSAIAINNANHLYAWDVTAAVAKELAGNDTASFLLKDKNSRNILVSFSASECKRLGVGPVLEVETEAGTEAVAERTERASEYRLQQNWPNPWNPSTVIGYTIGEGVSGRGGDGGRSVNVQLIVYDMLGREVKTLVNEAQRPGYYQVQFNGAGLASGIYIYRLTAGSYTASRQMLLLK